MIVFLRALIYGTPYAILTDASAPANWAVGVAIGTGLALLATRRSTRLKSSWLTRLAWSPVLLWGSVSHVLHGSGRMLQVLTGHRPWQYVGFIESRGTAETRDGLTLLALIQSAIPGSVAAEVDPDSRNLILNIIDAREREREAAAVKRFYERFQKRTVP